MRSVLFALLIVLALVLLTQATSGIALAWSPGNYHVVRPGDTLYSIAGQYGMSAWCLANANGVWNQNLVYVGQVLMIPQSGSYNYDDHQGYQWYNGNNWYGGYQGYDGKKGYDGRSYNGGYQTGYDGHQGYNDGNKYPYIPRQSYGNRYGCYYWVRYGDTLSSIAWKYGGDAWKIAHANGIVNLNWIYAGQRLLIPGCN
jgi:LysM repeat protein